MAGVGWSWSPNAETRALHQRALTTRPELQLGCWCGFCLKWGPTCPASERLAPDRARVEYSFMNTFLAKESIQRRGAKRASGDLSRSAKRSLDQAVVLLKQMVDHGLDFFGPKLLENVEGGEVQCLRVELGRLSLTKPHRVYYTIRITVWLKDGHSTARDGKVIPAQRSMGRTGPRVEEVWLLGQNIHGRLWMSWERTRDGRWAQSARANPSRCPRGGPDNLTRLLRQLPHDEMAMFTVRKLADGGEVQYLRMAEDFVAYCLDCPSNSKPGLVH